MANFAVPETITVHLGAPDQAARNITVSFPEYIKNVASSEIYPTWPESAIRANILAQITYALNRIYTEWYPSQGYDFDITSSTRYDQSFVENRDIYENISHIVDDIFNDYVVKQGTVQPYFTQYCSGTTATCEGLSQWGTVSLAEQGMVPYEILQHYYGDDINIIFDAPVTGPIRSYPGVPLRLGDANEEVRIIQRQLNRIGDNYPAIPKIPDTNGIFGVNTEEAVKTFQSIFGLTVDGIVGKATWYKIKSIYNGVKGLAELYSEGITPEEAQRAFAEILQEGDTGEPVRVAQYYLSVISYFDPQIPQVIIDGIFDQNTREAVLALQQRNGLEPTGIIDRPTWNAIEAAYDTTLNSLSPEALAVKSEIYPGRYLSLGISGEDVNDLQQFLQAAIARDPTLPPVSVTGTYDAATEAAVREIQRRAGITTNGIVGPLTWNRIIALSKA